MEQSTYGLILTVLVYLICGLIMLILYGLIPYAQQEIRKRNEILLSIRDYLINQMMMYLHNIGPHEKNKSTDADYLERMIDEIDRVVDGRRK